MAMLSKRRLVLLALGAALAGLAHAGGAVLDKNLLLNGGAEKGEASPDGYQVVPVPKWTTEGNFTVVAYGTAGFPTTDSPGPAKRGNQFFSGGDNNPASAATQQLNLKALAANIDSGTVQFLLSAYLGGFSSQNDHADLQVDFLDGSGAVLGSASLPTVLAVDRGNLSGMLKRKAQGFVPAFTRSASVTLRMTRIDGSYNDGYADSLSLVLTQP